MKMTSVRKHGLIIVLALCIVVLAGCGGASSSTPPAPTKPSSAATEQPVPVISSTQASGSDIPDTQVFVKYTSSSGKYQLVVAEGWPECVASDAHEHLYTANCQQRAQRPGGDLATNRACHTRCAGEGCAAPQRDSRPNHIYLKF